MTSWQTLLALALVAIATCPGILPAGTEQPAEAPDDAPWEGVLYEPKADYDQGVFEAEEEIAADAMTIWVITPTNRPPETDSETGLPVRHILVDPAEPWHRRCMLERARGHNDTIRRHLSLPALEAVEEPAETEPSADPEAESSGNP